MAISEYQTPKPVSLVGDPVIVEALTTSHLAAGAKTIVKEAIASNAISMDCYYNFGEADEEKYTFDFVTALTDEYDILRFDQFNDMQLWKQHIADRLNAVYAIRSKFIVTHEHTTSNDYVVWTSINYENIAFSVVVPTGDSFSQGGTPLQWNEGYMLGIRVYDENSQLIGELAERPPADGKVKFDISDLLEILPNPVLNLDGGILSYTDACKAYRYELYDKVGIPAVEQDHVWSDVYYGIYGKSSYMKGAKWNEELGSFYNEIQLNKSFLTLQPNNKKISPFAPELLAFLVFDETISTVKLNLQVDFTDASSQELTKSTIGGIKGKVLQINISPELLELFQIDSNKTVNSFTVVLRDQNDNDISRERTYIIDYETYDYLRFFIFRNDYGGGYDCLRSTGEVKNPVKIDKEFGSKALEADYTSKDRYEEQTSAKRTVEFELKWGLLKKLGGDPRDWKNYIQQVELSDDVFEYINSLTVPCSFITDSYNLHDDNRSVYTHTSVYRRAFVDEAYSDDDIPITGDYADDFNDDYFN